MSSGRRATSRSKSGTLKAAKSDKAKVEFLPPLKPKPILTIVLFAVLVLWLVGLVVLRFRAVKPYVNPTTASATP